MCYDLFDKKLTRIQYVWICVKYNYWLVLVTTYNLQLTSEVFGQAKITIYIGGHRQ